MIHAEIHQIPGQYADRKQSEAVHDARRLTDGATTARIVLDEQVYTLRITRAGKLILTK